jgi:hypothetical protein
MKYYFIYYECKRFSRRLDVKPLSFGSAYNITENTYQGVIKKHPLQFQIDSNKKYGCEREENGYGVKEEYKIISWNTLTEREYKKFNRHIG